MSKEFKNQERVAYSINGLTGQGVIVGKAVVELPTLGIGYIIQDCSGNFPFETYPFPCFVCYEIWLTPLTN